MNLFSYFVHHVPILSLRSFLVSHKKHCHNLLDSEQTEIKFVHCIDSSMVQNVKCVELTDVRYQYVFVVGDFDLIQLCSLNLQAVTCLRSDGTSSPFELHSIVLLLFVLSERVNDRWTHCTQRAAHNRFSSLLKYSLNSFHLKFYIFLVSWINVQILNLVKSQIIDEFS